MLLKIIYDLDKNYSFDGIEQVFVAWKAVKKDGIVIFKASKFRK